MKEQDKSPNNIRKQDTGHTPNFSQEFKSIKANIFWYYVDRIAFSVDRIAKLYEKTIGDAYRNERNKFNLSTSKKILHIGCGFYPITAMILAEMNGAEIVTIDKNYKSVRLARKVISRKKLDKKIKAEVGNGTDYPLDNFDTIIVSGCSFPKIDVLKHIIKNSKQKTRIIIRDSFLDIEKIIKTTNSHGKITFVEKIKNNPIPLPKWEWDSFYLVKN